VVLVYEAGPLGFGLYRELTARGVRCYVCAPDSSEQKKKRRKNNAIDTRTLTSNLFNYLNGNERALQLVRVPTEEQEQARLQSRQHDQLVEERKRLGAKGNALLLFRCKIFIWCYEANRGKQGAGPSSQSGN
jgi:transposase